MSQQIEDPEKPSALKIRYRDQHRDLQIESKDRFGIVVFVVTVIVVVAAYLHLSGVL
jgi:hypothetical protein